MLKRIASVSLNVLLYLFLISNLSSVALAQVKQTKPLTNGFELNYHSKILDQDIQMHIRLPDNFDTVSDAHRYPVIFINGSHGRQFFVTLSGIVSHLGKLERMPESIIVSLNYSGHFPDAQTNGMWRKPKINGWGKPEQYRRHLKQELFPLLAEQYRANDHRLLIGISGSSLFPLDILTNAPEMFHSYMLVAAADMLGMSFVPGKTMVEQIFEVVKKSPDLKGLLYAVNSDDDIYNSRVDYRPQFVALNQQAKALGHKGFKVKTEVIENERHYDVLIKGLLSWFEQLYPEAKWAPKYRDLIAQPGDALDNIDNYFNQLSKDYGFTILPKANRWNSVNCLRFISGMLMRDGRLEESVRVTRRWIEYQPNSSQAYDQLAQSLEKSEQLQDAVKAISKAVKLAKQNDDWRLEDYEKFLASLKTKL